MRPAGSAGAGERAPRSRAFGECAFWNLAGMLDGMGREEMRAADGDRHAVADKLRALPG